MLLKDSMDNTNKKLMRDVFIEGIYNKMHEDSEIFFLSDDFGSSTLDKLREKFEDRFINVGIAEQNLINISTGLALEGFTIYVYAIAPFLAMRAYEQIKLNLSLHSQTREINVNLISVGAGLSYDISGATHHSLEDICIMRVLPHIILFSPSDWVLTESFVDFSIKVKKPKYIRLDGKPLPQIYSENHIFNLEEGFYEFIKGGKICIVATGYMTHVALRVAEELLKDNIRIGIIDTFLLKPINTELLFNTIKDYEYVITMEEGFKNKGGLDTLIADILCAKQRHINLIKVGFEDTYVLETGDRDYLHRRYGLDKDSIVKTLHSLLQKR